MEENYKKITIFVSCPKDVEKYKNYVNEVVLEINDKPPYHDRIFLQVKEFRRSVVPHIGKNAQTIINEQIEDIEDYDIFIGILGKRFGTPTGNYDPSTQEEYESGTLEEFSRAQLKKENGNNIFIKFLFKKNVSINLTKDTEEDIEQVKKVLAFKNSLIKKHKFIDEFTTKGDFKDKIRDFIIFAIKNINITSEGLNDQNIIGVKYEPVEEYLPRTIMPYEDYISSEYSYLWHFNSKDITEIIKKTNRIVLIADAAMGKTTELKRIAAYFSSKKENHIPFFCSLNLYTNNKIEDLLPDSWRKKPLNNVLLLFDGLDEINSSNRDNFIREIEKFSNDHQQTKIIVTCRSNFYVSESQNFSGTLKSFLTYVLNRLSDKEKNIFIKKKLSNQRTSFFEAVSNNKTIDLLAIPFYLKYLVQRFQKDKKLPGSRNEIYIELINNRIHLDEEHFRTVNSEKSLIESRILALKSIQKIAISMEVLCRNSITTSEYMQIIPSEQIRNLLRHKTLWNSKNEIWQFEHNNFQEFLAAQVLSNLPLNKIKKIITVDTNHKVIHPSWINTLSFLLNIYKNKNLKEWILTIQPEVAIKFEPTRIGIALRENIFQKIFKNYKGKKIWIDREKFNIRELAHFGESKKTIKYLLNHIVLNQYYTTLTNALELIANMNIPLETTEKVKISLQNIALKYHKVEVKSEAIIVIAALKLNSEDMIDFLFREYSKSENDWIRYGMYYLIENSNYLDKYIDYFLDGIKFYKNRFSNGDQEPRIGNEFMHLESALTKANGIESIVKILDYFLNNISVFHIIGFDRIFPKIFNNVTEAYTKTSSQTILDKMIRLYIALNSKYLHSEANYCVIFFDKSNTKWEAFNYIYRKRKEFDSYNLFNYLAPLITDESSNFIISDYQNHNLTNDDIHWTLNALENKNSPFYNDFYKKINHLTDNKFKKPKPRNFSKEREEKFRREIHLLFNELELLSNIKTFFRKKKIRTLKKSEIINFRDKDWLESNYPNLLYDILEEITTEAPYTYKKIKEIIKSEIDFDYISARQIYRYLTNNQDFQLSDSQIKYLETWCLNQLQNVDFTKAIKQRKSSKTVNELAVLLYYFFKEYKFNYPKPILLDMISFHWFGEEIDYLENFLSQTEIEKRILENLKNPQKNDSEIISYFNYSKKHNLLAAKKYAINEILNEEKDLYIRELGLELIDSLGISNKKLLSILSNLKDDFKWKIVKLLIKKNSKKVEEYLLNIFHTENSEQQLSASRHLIACKNLEGLKYYVVFLQKKKEFYPNTFLYQSIANIGKSSAIPYLMNLLKLSYDKDLKQDRYKSLNNLVESALTNIALTNPYNYNKVNKAVLTFINKNKKDDFKINFLFTYLEKLERQFYITKSQSITIDDTIAKLKSLGIWEKLN